METEGRGNDERSSASDGIVREVSFVRQIPLYVLSLLVTAMFLFTCSDVWKVGIGSRVYLALVETGGYFYPLGFTTCALIVLLVVLDAHFWKSALGRIMRSLMVGVLVPCALVTCLTMTKTYSAALHGVYLLAIPMVYGLASRLPLYQNDAPGSFTKALCGPLQVSAILALALWLGWVFDSSEELCGARRTWNTWTREELYYETECKFEILVINRDQSTVYHEYKFGQDGNQSSLIRNTIQGYELNDTHCYLRTIHLLFSHLDEELEKLPGFGLNQVEIEEWDEYEAGSYELIDHSMKGQDQDTNRTLPRYVRIKYSGCLPAFLVWLSPFLYASVSIAFAIVLRYVSVIRIAEESCAEMGVDLVAVGGANGTDSVPAMRSKSKTPNDLNAQDLEKIEKALTDKNRGMYIVNMLVRCIMVLALGIWVAAGIAGAEMELSSIVMSVSMAGFMVLFVTCGSVIGWKSLWEHAKGVPIVQRIQDSVASDWAKGFLLLSFGPIIAMALVLSFMTQCFRKAGLPWNKRLDEAKRKSHFTCETQSFLRKISAWEWRSVLVKAIWFGIFVQTVYIGISKLTSVFLSWFNSFLVELNLPFSQVVMAFIVIGLIMFFIPVIPGVPVYISGGIILVNVGMEQMGFWTSTLFTIAVCCLLKAVAIFVQQKCFGVLLGKYITIRRLVGVNSVTVKGIKLILSKPGFSMGKVAILTGGPDWPTSVMTGILDLPFFQMLLGSIPVVFLIAPCVLSGALLLREQEGGIWGSLGIVSIGISFFTQMGSMLVALIYIEDTVYKRRAEIEAMPNDEEVLAIESSTRAAHGAYIRSLDWHQRYGNHFPVWVKLVLVAGAISMSGCCYLTTLMGSSCFEDFAVSDSIEERLGGNIANLVKKPLGHITIVLLVIPIVCLIVFNCWASRYVAHHRCAVAVAPSLMDSPEENKNAIDHQ